MKGQVNQVKTTRKTVLLAGVSGGRADQTDGHTANCTCRPCRRKRRKAAYKQRLIAQARETRPASMLQPVECAAAMSEAELRKVPMRPVTEAEEAANTPGPAGSRQGQEAP